MLRYFLIICFLSSYLYAEVSYYETLNIPRSASDKDIKRAFRKMARKYHPDKNKEKDAEIKFRNITEEERKKYDSYGHDHYKSFAKEDHGDSSYSMHDFFDDFDEMDDVQMPFGFGDFFNDDSFFGSNMFSDHSENHQNGRRCVTRTVREGNSVYTTTECY